jgi:hypothetical protein
MDEDIIDESFMQSALASKDIVAKRQNTRSAKDGEVAVTGTIESYTARVPVPGKGMRTVTTPTPPPTEMRPTRDGKKKYPAALTLNVKLESLSLIEGEIKARTDGKAGWSVRQQLKYFSDATDYFSKHRGFIWSEDCDEDHKRMRDFVSITGSVATERWMPYSKGDMVKVKVSDNKDNVFRKDVPDKPGLRLVQPSTPVVFLNVETEVWINIVERTTDDETAGGASGATEGGGGAAAGAPAAAAAAAAEAAGAKKVVTKALQISPMFNCKGGTVISEDYDPTMPHTERLHDQRDANAHNMVPVECLRDKTMTVPRSAYFYVKKTRQTRWSPDSDPQLRGVTIVRDEVQDLKDFVSEFQDVKYPCCVVRFNVWQWHAGDKKKNERNRYHVVARAKKEDNLWRKFGITQLDPYAFIVGSNLDLPLHLDVEVWEGITVSNESNKLDKINNKDEVKDMRGYYTYGIKDIVPDFLRHFRTNGMRVSTAWVSKEFRYWETTNRATGRAVVRLHPVDDKVDNPVNAGGILSAVLALGNGWYPMLDDPNAKDPNDQVGVNHAYKGDIAPLYEGTHDFYVLTSYCNWTPEDKQKWLGPHAPPADDFVDVLKSKFRVHYWIYAVRKDAKMSLSYTKAVLAGQTPTAAIAPVVAAAAPVAPVQEKRERTPSISSQAESESESEVSVGGTKTRSRRVAAVKKSKN